MPDTVQSLPIRRLTLYKHGVGFVERRGPVEGPEIGLTFRADEVNDVLKSLLALDASGGQVLGIHYDTPGDPAARLADSGIVLGPDHSLLDLLRGLRGWRVALTAGRGGGTEMYTGRLLGVEVVEGKPVSKARVTILLDGDARVANLPLGEVSGISLLEERAAQDLRFFLDSSRSEERHRTVRIRLSPGTHDLAVSYLVPSPTWRVSYRLVAERRAGADAGPDASPDASAAGELVLQGWGLFDNRLEEDLDGVAVTLVAGQPISFVYDLAASHIPERPVVADAARIAPGPVEFAAMAPPPMPAAAPSLRAMSVAEGGARSRKMAGGVLSADAVAASLAPTASGTDLGDLFQYDVAAPVSVRRGESALVPILQDRLPYRRQLLYNGAKFPTHPVPALRFTNATGLVLERGPVTILEDGDYRGEAIVPFTKAGGEVYLAFAVELGVKVTEAQATRTQIATLRIENAYVKVQEATIQTTTFTLESSLAEPQTVTVEHAVRADAQLVDTRPPDEQNAEFYRWEVACPARGSAVFSVAQRSLGWRWEQVINQSYDQLQQYLRDRWLDAATVARLKALLDARQTILNNGQEIARLGNERTEIFGRQEQLRQNMAALAPSGDEGVLRQKVFAQLAASEDRVAAIEGRVAALRADSEVQQQRIDAELQQLRTP